MPNSFDETPEYEPEFSVEDVLDDSVRLNPEATAALKAFRSAKPWRGTFAERCGKFTALHAALAPVYGLEVRLVLPRTETPERPGNGGFFPADAPGVPEAYRGAVVLTGKLSVVTYLHCLGKARGMNRREACRWSINVFRKIFPRSFGAASTDGFRIVK